MELSVIEKKPVVVEEAAMFPNMLSLQQGDNGAAVIQELMQYREKRAHTKEYNKKYRERRKAAREEKRRAAREERRQKEKELMRASILQELAADKARFQKKVEEFGKNKAQFLAELAASKAQLQQERNDLTAKKAKLMNVLQEISKNRL